MADNFDLSQFITGSLCVRETSNPSVKPVHPVTDPFSYLFKDDVLNIMGVSTIAKRKEDPENAVRTPIQEFYRGLNLFITGGSGFIGKVLVEKLLRSIPDIGHVYVLIREKRGKNCQERFQLMMEDKFFLRLKTELPNYHKKITALSGDMSLPGLGLSEEDRQMIQDTVHVVYHCAADVRFLEPLRISIESNVLGSKRVMELAKQITHLKSYVHVSTAYSQCVNRVIEETVPKMNLNYKEIIRYVEANTDKHIEDNLQRILQEWPNTYSFSKALCENMIQEESGDLPICIFRPSIVANTVKEPFRGWTDNLFGVGGLMLASSLGIVHHVKIDLSNTVDIVPVDYVVNCMIAASWKTGMKRDKTQPYVLNYTMSPRQSVSWNTFGNLNKFIEKWPCNHGVWYPSYFLIDSVVLDHIFYYVHNIQGIILDAAAVLVAQKPRLRKVYSLLNTTKRVVYYFTSGYWEFKNENVLELLHSMSKEDKEIFDFDTSNINVFENVLICLMGMRYFFLKEPVETVPKAERKIKWFRFAHNTLKLAFGYAVLKLAVSVAHILPF